mmetsp:Transcript_8642/g.26006  ORF Transcript_8642/g.26006 Transcript_8642/m.26006 type:complete len:464 (+) Transcript_8642:186-1577(+)
MVLGYQGEPERPPEPVKKGANTITLALLRKRSEHNEGMISTMEELTLHQEELVAISPLLGSTCRKLKILYLQNNIISKMENLHHMKDLEYLNLALNNIPKIEGLGKCEFLNKLDMTVNFVDVDELEASYTHLRQREHLKELYMMGNPAQANWPGFKNYTIAMLPQLEYLDGERISKSCAIIARQAFPKLALELRELAAAKRAEKAAKEPVDMETLDINDKAPYTPEVRVKMYEEIAEQKAEKEAREKERQPRERDHEAEQKEAVERAREREEQGKIQQCNQGKWEFHWDEESKPGCIIFELHVQRHLDSSLIDLDVHPKYLSVVIKSKVIRLALPAEVRASDAKAQRSKTSGHLVVTMPKVDAQAGPMFLQSKAKKEKEAKIARLEAAKGKRAHLAPLNNRSSAANPNSVGSLLMADAKHGGMTATSTVRKHPPPPPPPPAPEFPAPEDAPGESDDEEPPPLS